MSVPDRPMHIRLGVPYLAVPWTLVMVLLERHRSPAGALAFGIGVALVVAAWYALLYRVWRGRPVAISAISLLVIGLSGLMLFAFLAYPVIVVVGAKVIGLVAGTGDLGWNPLTAADSVLWWAVVLGNGLALVAGITMRRKVVQEWSDTRFPVKDPSAQE